MDGGLFTLGRGDRGQLGHGSTEACTSAVHIGGLRHVVQVACGSEHTCAVTAEGRAYTWGSGLYGALGHSNLDDLALPAAVEALTDFKVLQAACGAHHSLFLTESCVLSCGLGDDGELGQGDETYVLSPQQVSGLTDVTAISCGHHHSAALTSQGVVYTWGLGAGGRLGLASLRNESTPQPVRALDGKFVQQVACGGHHMAAITDHGSIYVWGEGTKGQLGLKLEEGHLHVAVPTILDGVDAVRVSCGEHHTALVNSSAQVLTFGAGAFGRLGHGDDDDQDSPKPVARLKEKRATDVACGFYHTVVVVAGLEVWGCGQDGASEQVRSTPHVMADLSQSHVVQVACGGFHTAAILSVGDAGHTRADLDSAEWSEDEDTGHGGRNGILASGAGGHPSSPLAQDDGATASAIAPTGSINMRPSVLGVRPAILDNELDSRVANVILTQSNQLDDVVRQRDLLQSEAAQLRVQVDSLERNNQLVWTQRTADKEDVLKILGEHQVAMDAMRTMVDDIATKVVEHRAQTDSHAEVQQAGAGTLGAQLEAMHQHVGERISMVSMSMQTLMQHWDESQEELDKQKRLHAEDKQILTSVIKDLKQSLTVAHEDKDQVWVQANATKDALSSALTDVAQARGAAQAAQAQEEEAKAALRTARDTHTNEIRTLQEEMNKAAEEHAEALETRMTKNTRLARQLESSQESLVAARVEVEVLQKRCQEAEEAATAAAQELARSNEELGAEVARLTQRVHELAEDNELVSKKLETANGELRDTSARLQSTTKDKGVLTTVMKQVEAKHKAAIEAAQEQFAAKQSECDAERMRTDEVRAEVKARDKRLLVLRGALGELQGRARNMRTQLVEVRDEQSRCNASVAEQVVSAKVAFGRLQEHQEAMTARHADLHGRSTAARDDFKSATEAFTAEREVLVRVLRGHQSDSTKWEAEKEKLQTALNVALSQLNLAHTERAQKDDRDAEQNQALTRSLANLESALEQKQAETTDLKHRCSQLQLKLDKAEAAREEVWVQSRADKEMTTKLIQHLEEQVRRIQSGA